MDPSQRSSTPAQSFGWPSKRNNVVVPSEGVQTRDTPSLKRSLTDTTANGILRLSPQNAQKNDINPVTPPARLTSGIKIPTGAGNNAPNLDVYKSESRRRLSDVTHVAGANRAQMGSPVSLSRLLPAAVKPKPIITDRSEESSSSQGRRDSDIESQQHLIDEAIRARMQSKNDDFESVHDRVTTSRNMSLSDRMEERKAVLQYRRGSVYDRASLSSSIRVNYQQPNSFYQNRLARAYFGSILSILERPRSNRVWIARLTNHFLPALGLIIEFIQFSSFNGYILPGNIRWKYHGMPFEAIPNGLFLLDPQNADFSFGFAIFAVFAVVAFLYGLGTQFYIQNHSTLFVQVISAYIFVITGVLYIPVTNMLVFQLTWYLSRPSPLNSFKAFMDVLAILLFVPFTLFMSQNWTMIGDKYSWHLFKRCHNRVGLLTILVKTVLSFQYQKSGPMTRAVTCLVSYCLLLICHFLTHVYFHEMVNTMFQSFYLTLIFGASCRLASVTKYPGQEYSPADETYWQLCIVAIFVGVVIRHHRLLAFRYRANQILIKKLSYLDFADNPDLINRFGLSKTLKTATRLGNYAQYLVERDNAGDSEEADRFFRRALKCEPIHPDNLGRYANHLKTARKDQADMIFQKAIELEPDHLRNLEMYASFLNEVTCFFLPVLFNGRMKINIT